MYGCCLVSADLVTIMIYSISSVGMSLNTC